jgi:hypothetical protein
VDHAGSNTKGKIQAVAQPIREEEFGGREADIIFGELKDGLGVILGAVDHIVL